MESQNDQILAHLQSGKSITSLEAIDLYGITRLGGRIFNLHEAGHKVISEMIPVINRAGKAVRVARYSLPPAKPTPEVEP